MADKPRISPHASRSQSNRRLVQEGQVMRGIVRNMVVNMECVLKDLQGIMGDIQSLVGHIDAVTEKIDKDCKAEGGSPSKGASRHFRGKHQYQPVASRSSSDVHSVTQPQHRASSSDTQIQLQQQQHEQHAGIGNQQVERLRNQDDAGLGLSKGQPQKSSRKEFSRPLSHPHSNAGGKAGFSCSANIYYDNKAPGISKSFHHFPKNGSVLTSPSGGIAVVYPTILSVPRVTAADTSIQQNPVVEEKEKQSASKPLCRSSALPTISASNTSFSQICPSTKQFIESASSSHILSSQRHVMTSVYNLSFQPVTPTEQPSPVSPYDAKVLQSHNNPTSVRDQKLADDKQPMHGPTVRDISKHGNSLPGSPIVKRSTLHPNQRSIPNSPSLRRSSTKPVYCQVDGSPISSRSPLSGRRSRTPHFYYSIESDLDSDAVSECPDGRSVTPDMDWSYLNLVGNRHTRGQITSQLSPIESDYTYETPVVPGRMAQTFQMLQSSPDVVARLPSFPGYNPLPAEQCGRRGSGFSSNGQLAINVIYNSPLMTHVFCSEVIDGDSSDYCGCYEAVVDSVLENISGFESFEDACNDLESDETVHETYVSFDDEFEEDHWDMELRPDDQDDFEVNLPPFVFNDFYDIDRNLFGKVDALDGINEFEFHPSATAAATAAAASSESSSRHTESKALKSEEIQRGEGRQIQHGPEPSAQKENKRILSPLYVDNEVYDNVELTSNIRKSFTDEDCVAIKPSVSGQHQNFTLCPQTLDLNTRHTFPGEIQTGQDAQMSSSDEVSCQAVGSGSPMSFSSPEAAVTSPDTDRFVTSSEGDDLFTSQEEAYMSSSCVLPDSNGNSNPSCHRTNMRDLRREFFNSLYSVCEKRDRESCKDTSSEGAHEENIPIDQNSSRVDNTVDNCSDTGSFHEDVSSYNRNVNTWTAYALVHMQSDDVSDSASDIINDNNVTCSMTSSYIDADNIGAASGQQAVTF